MALVACTNCGNKISLPSETAPRLCSDCSLKLAEQWSTLSPRTKIAVEEVLVKPPSSYAVSPD